MSYCREEGKDKVTFITKEDEERLVKEAENKPCRIFEGDGINWSSPCVGGGTQLEGGPCVEQYREAFTCFILNKEEHVEQCYDKFVTWQNCMAENPDDYDKILKDMGEDREEDREVGEKDSNAPETTQES